MKKSDKTRQFIIDKAADLFNTQGYSGTSMADIMEVTGLSKGAIYGNFKREGGDKKGVKELELLLQQRAQQGGAVLLTTHHELQLKSGFKKLQLGMSGNMSGHLIEGGLS